MKICVYVTCHKNYYIPPFKFLTGLQVGKFFSSDIFTGMLNDNNKDNISYLNKSYCELTGQYWVWKNKKSDIVGFFHYRRYFNFKNQFLNKPYIIRKLPTAEQLNNMGYDEEHIGRIFSDYDIIVPIPEKIYISVYEQYITSEYHKKKDIDLMINIVKKKYPHMIKAVDRYIYGDSAYYGNMYIMRWKLFDEYMQWLFSVLEEFDRFKDTTGYTKQELRVNGYLAERLFGVYLAYLTESKHIRVFYAQRVYYECFEGNLLSYYKKKLINFILPPGSNIRYIVKKFIKRQ